ncbi:hypothetical protein ACWDTD_20070, partial [Gordonia sp. NPDC003425]
LKPPPLVSTPAFITPGHSPAIAEMAKIEPSQVSAKQTARFEGESATAPGRRLMFRDEVTARYADEFKDTDRVEFEGFVSAETERLAAELTMLQADLVTRLRVETQARLGRTLEYVETVNVLSQAQQRALEEVRFRLWEGYVPAPLADEDDLELNAVDTIEVSAETEALVERVWPYASPAWQVSAELIVEARTADGLPIPTASCHPLATTLAAIVDQDVAHDVDVLARARSTRVQLGRDHV